MFNKENRYITKGINEVVDIRLQIFMWRAIDNLKDKVEKVDYLQVFEIEKEYGTITIKHRQEVPEHKEEYIIELCDIDVIGKIKVFVIDSGDYSTMLLAEEY